MLHDRDSQSEVRPRQRSQARSAGAAALAPGTPLLGDEGGQRARYLTLGLAAATIALVLAVIAYETFVSPQRDLHAWKPPSGLTVEDTPHWLQTLCAERTQELCAAADRARTAEDCDAMRAALRELENVDRRLSARGGISAQQHWVLVELYGQGHELCQFDRTGTPAAAPK